MSDTNQPSPGPWRTLCGNCGSMLGLVDGEGQTIAMLGRASAVKPEDISLIEAAPDMLEALRALVADLEMRSNFKTGDQKGVVDCGNGVYQGARAALAKAQGRVAT